MQPFIFIINCFIFFLWKIAINVCYGNITNMQFFSFVLEKWFLGGNGLDLGNPIQIQIFGYIYNPNPYF